MEWARFSQVEAMLKAFWSRGYVCLNEWAVYLVVPNSSPSLWTQPNQHWLPQCWRAEKPFTKHGNLPPSPNITKTNGYVHLYLTWLCPASDTIDLLDRLTIFLRFPHSYYFPSVVVALQYPLQVPFSLVLVFLKTHPMSASFLYTFSEKSHPVSWLLLRSLCQWLPNLYFSSLQIQLPSRISPPGNSWSHISTLLQTIPLLMFLL